VVVEVGDDYSGAYDSADWLRVELRTFGRVCRLVLSGALSGTSIAALEAQVDQLGCIPFEKVVIDVGKLTSLDPVGARVLFGLYHYVEAKGGKLKIVGASKQIESTLRRFRADPQVSPSGFDAKEALGAEIALIPIPVGGNEVGELPVSSVTRRVSAISDLPARNAGRAQRRWQMSDDNLGEVSDATKEAEEEEAAAAHVADRAPTAEEEADAEGQTLDDGVAEHYEDMAERGANVKGEGSIS
jgi:anti-anti-sigma factor